MEDYNDLNNNNFYFFSPDEDDHNYSRNLPFLDTLDNRGNWLKMFKLLTLQREQMIEYLGLIITNEGFYNQEAIDNSFINLTYYAFKEHNEIINTLIKGNKNALLYLNLLQIEFETIIKGFKQKELREWIYPQKIILDGCKDELYRELIFQFGTAINDIDEYIHDKYETLFWMEYDPNLKKEYKTTEDFKPLEKIIISTTKYNKLLLRLKESENYPVTFNPVKGEYTWRKNRQREYLVGLAKRLYEYSWIIQDNYTSNPQNLRNTFNNFFHCYTSKKIWQEGAWKNNLKSNKFSFITLSRD
jgi:hypothetical protein